MGRIWSLVCPDTMTAMTFTYIHLLLCVGKASREPKVWANAAAVLHIK